MRYLRLQQWIGAFRWWQVPIALDIVMALWAAIVLCAVRNIPSLAQCTRTSQDCDWLIRALVFILLMNILSHVGLFATAKGDCKGNQLLYGLFHILFFTSWLWMVCNYLLANAFGMLS